MSTPNTDLNVRLKIIKWPLSRNPVIRFLVIRKGRVTFMSGEEVLIALTELAGAGAAELRFKLEDCQDCAAVLHLVRDCLSTTFSPDEALWRLEFV